MAANRRVQAKKVEKSELVIAIVSDIHAHVRTGSPDNAPSFCEVGESDPMKNSLEALKQFLGKEKLRADILLSPGDLGDRAHPAALRHAWSELQQLKKLLHARELAVTTGNHDIDSRHAHNNLDSRASLQALTPKYPFPSQQANDRYWSRHFVSFRRDAYRLVILNSSAFHGESEASRSTDKEYESGRVTEATIAAIKSELDADKTQPPVNILLCHHHPHPHADLGLGSQDLMEGGQLLLDLLGSGKYGSWLIVHGHKHQPKISIAASEGNFAPVVFAAGSVAVTLYRNIASHTRNQFHLIRLPLAMLDKYGLVGTVESWDYFALQGWKPGGRESKLPGRSGFGWRGTVQALAERVGKKIKGPFPLKWEDVCMKVPELRFVGQTDLNTLVGKLRADGVTVSPEDTVPPLHVWRRQ
jgi:3',5'-cyclic AMP phosphodiesterase CpdA